jgi:TatD DNase family protein
VFPAVQSGNFAAVRGLAHALGDGYCLGIHPLYVAQAGADALPLLDAALQRDQHDPHLLAVGEIGLDLFEPALRVGPLRDKQLHFFVEQLKLARRYQLPVVLHSRQAVDPVRKALRDVAGPGGRWQGIAHAFNGSMQQAQALLDLGLKLGFGGAMTFERALQLRRLAVSLPLEAIVLETDAPDMPPQWLYTPAAQRQAGQPQQPNSPLELPRIGEVLAGLRALPAEVVAAQTSLNALQALPRLALCQGM